VWVGAGGSGGELGSRNRKEERAPERSEINKRGSSGSVSGVFAHEESVS